MALPLELRFLWGESCIGEYVFKPGDPRTFRVGSGADADFVVPGPTRVLARGAELIDEDGVPIALGVGEVFRLDFGAIRLEARRVRVPRPPFIPWEDRLDFRMLNIGLVVFALAALWVITAANRSVEADGAPDDLGAAPGRLVKALFTEARAKPAPAPRAAFHGREGRAGTPTAPERDARASGRRGTQAPRGKDLARQLLGPGLGLAGVLTAGSGDALKVALGHVTGRQVGDAQGLLGMGIRGDGPGGGGPDESFTIGSLRRPTKNVGEGPALAPGKHFTPGFSTTRTDCGVDASCFDRELIRQVIHQNRNQVRYCYESELAHQPTMAGKLSVRFVIGAGGAVLASDVERSELGNATVESCVTSRVRTWIFPKLKGGGTATVVYPFIFKQVGE